MNEIIEITVSSFSTNWDRIRADRKIVLDAKKLKDAQAFVAGTNKKIYALKIASCGGRVGRSSKPDVSFLVLE